MTDESTALGHIRISRRAIATITSQATLKTYGVVGLAPKNFLDGLTNVLVNDPAHGIQVGITEGLIDIDIYVIVEYGTRIKSVAASVANAVRYNVEKTLGMPVNAINVHVQGLRISNND